MNTKRTGTKKLYICTNCFKHTTSETKVNQTWFWSGTEETLICEECANAEFQQILEDTNENQN